MRRSLVNSHPVYTLVLPTNVCSVCKLPSGTPGHASPADLFAPAAVNRVLQCFCDICDFEPFPRPPTFFILIYVVAEECFVRFLKDVPRETPLFDALSKTL